MTRRLALTIVGVVVATLLLAGVGTLALAAVRARNSTEAEVRSQAVEVAANLGDFLDPGVSLDTNAGQRMLRNRIVVLARMRKILSIDELVVLVADATDQFDPADLPASLTLGDIEPDLLAENLVVSGTAHRLAYAAAPARTPSGRLFAVVTTQQVDAGLGAAVRLFVWAAGATILLGLAAAYLLGRRLTRPIRDASLATQAIAAGRLTTRMEEPPADRHDEVAELQRSINHMASSLERSRVLEQQFLLSVSHDLRTPLTSIRGYAEAIDDGNADPKRAAGVIRGEARRLERLVADLLDLAKLEARAFRFDLQPVDLAAAVHTATAGAAGSRPGIEFHPFTTGRLIVSADPDRLAQVLANLVENAGKYARSTVAVSARAEGGNAVVTVDDDGPGIATHDLPHVFERLYVARHAPARRESSSGLGLAIVRELVTAMGGEVAAGVAPHGGARLSFTLPLVTPA